MESRIEPALGSGWWRSRRRTAMLVCGAFAVVILVACGPMSCGPTPPFAKGQIAICAQDPVRGDCVTGDFQPVGATQSLRLVATDDHGNALAHTSLNVAVSGANARSGSVTTAADGSVLFTYSGTQHGTDLVKATLAQGNTTLSPGPAVIHWESPQTFMHPIIFVHGINEDASVYRHAIAQDDANELAHHKEGTEIFEALDLVYDRSFIEAFCYIDDHAYSQTPSGCPDPETPTCVSGTDTSACMSQSAVDPNAVALAQTVSALSARAGGKQVTLIGYSMGAAIIRTLLAGCRNSPNPADMTACNTALGQIDRVFFLNGAQQGSWLMAVKAGLDPASLTGEGIPSGPAAAFSTFLPLLESSAFLAVKDKMGLDVNLNAERDLTPQSVNILAHNSVLPPPGIDLYNFYGDIRIRLNVNLFAYQVLGPEQLPLGDLVMLAQDDAAQSSPLWGGAALCDGCSMPITLFREAGQYHAWALLDQHDINVSTLTPLLGVPGAVSGFNAAINSPVQHLNVTQPVAQAPGTVVQVHDITGLAGTSTTDIPEEIVAILMQKDGLA